MYPKEVADATFSVGLTWVHRHFSQPQTKSLIHAFIMSISKQQQLNISCTYKFLTIKTEEPTV